MDILRRENLELPGNVVYHELDDRDYRCTPVESGSIDFVFSFGVFCHLPNSAVRQYVESIYRVLRPGGTALVMFADFHRHFEFSKRRFPNKAEIVADPALQDKYRERETIGGWFWSDIDTIQRYFSNAGFRNYLDVSPDGFRDCLIFASRDGGQPF